MGADFAPDGLRSRLRPMLRNYLAAALRNISRSPLYAAISVSGLAVGIASALLATIVIHTEYHYDDFVPGYERTYLVAHIGPGSQESEVTSSHVARVLPLYVRGIEAVARTMGGRNGSSSLWTARASRNA